MEFNFDTRNTSVSRAYKLLSFPLFAYAKWLAIVFLYLFIISLLFVGASFFGILPENIAIKISIVSALLAIVFCEIYLFVKLKITKPKISLSLSSAIKNSQTYNMAEFLSIDACGIIEEAIRVCKKRRLSEVTSESILYAALKINNEVKILMYRLGIDVKTLKEDIKNYLEKQPRQEKFNLLLSKPFQETIKEAAGLAVLRGHATIGEKELLTALVHCDEFFKKVLVEHDLKEKDVENITLWLDVLEDRILQSKKFWTKENLSRFGSLGKDWASGFTVTLDQFSIDWTSVISKDIFSEVIGHKKEADEVEIVLAKSKLSNALIIGEAGVGRKSIVQVVASRCFLGTGLPELRNKKVVELNMISLLAQVQGQENLEITLDQIFLEVLTAGNIILVIDSLENFVEQKISRPGSADISVILGKYLSLPNFHFIGIASFDGLHRNMEQNPSFLEYFRKIEVLEVSESDTIRILQNVALRLEARYRILITYPAIREIINLTGRYFPSTPFPKKAIDVLDEAATYVKSMKEKIVLPSHVAKIVSDKTQIPVGKMEFKEKSVLLNLENLISQKIIGQQEAVNEIAIALRRARSGLGSKKRPMGVFLFLGPTGVGKTETAKVLAEIYFGRAANDFTKVQSSDLAQEKMIRIDMSEFQSMSDVGRLIGQAVPVEQEGLLTTPVRENPFSLVLLDEIEKAHPNILNLFLQVFDEGHITDGQGRKILFTNTIIICTSNAGAELIFKQAEAGSVIKKDDIIDVLFAKGIFRPEFINRFDATVLFHLLTKENLMDIAQLHLLNLQKNLKEKDINFIITGALKEKIVELSYKPEFGAREMRRVVQDTIENVIAAALLSDKIARGDTIEINPENFEIVRSVI